MASSTCVTPGVLATASIAAARDASSSAMPRTVATPRTTLTRTARGAPSLRATARSASRARRVPVVVMLRACRLRGRVGRAERPVGLRGPKTLLDRCDGAHTRRMREMSPPTIEQVRDLAQVRAGLCVTVYGPSEHWMGESGSVTEANAVCALVEHQLRASGASDSDTSIIIGRLRESSDRISRADVRVVPSVGIFATVDGVTVQPMTTRPAPVALVSDRFLIGPLVAAALAAIPPVFVLAVSANAVRLIDATATPAETVPVAYLPIDLDQTVRLDLTGDRQALAHLRTSEDPKTRLREYSRAIAKAVEPALRTRAPLLVIAATEPLAGMVRSALGSQHIAGETIPGNHDDRTADDLALLAAPIAARARSLRVGHQLDRFAEMPSRGRALIELREVVDACRSGAVDTLLVDVDCRVPIPSQASTAAITLDLVDEAVRSALDTQATVVPVGKADLPSNDPVAAILRYPLPVRHTVGAQAGVS